MSRAQPGRAIVDAGLKASSVDSGMPAVWQRPGLKLHPGVGRARLRRDRGGCGGAGAGREAAARAGALRSDDQPVRLVCLRARRGGGSALADRGPWSTDLNQHRYGWVVVACAFTLTFVGFGVAYSFAAFFKAFQAEFGASRAHVSLVFSLCALLWFSFGVPGGLLADRFGPRGVCLAGALAIAGGLAAAAHAPSLEILYVTYSVGIGVGIGLCLRAFGRRGPALVRAEPRRSPGASRSPASARATCSCRRSPRGGSSCGAGAAPTSAWPRWRCSPRCRRRSLLGGRAATRAQAAGIVAARHDAWRGDQEPPVLAHVRGGVPHLRRFLRADGAPRALRAGRGPHRSAGREPREPAWPGEPARALRHGRRRRAPRARALAGGDRRGPRRSCSSCGGWRRASGCSRCSRCASARSTAATWRSRPRSCMDLFGPRSLSAILGSLYTAAGLATLIGPTFAGASFDAFGSYDASILGCAALCFARRGARGGDAAAFPSPRMSRRPALTVSEERGVRTLHVGGEAIQSSMRLSRPFALELDYTRCMTSFLLFHPRPRRALKIGLGGGSLVKFFWRQLPWLRTRVVELDERVVAVARAQFHLPPDDARLAVELGDGARGARAGVLRPAGGGRLCRRASAGGARQPGVLRRGLARARGAGRDGDEFHGRRPAARRAPAAHRARLRRHGAGAARALRPERHRHRAEGRAARGCLGRAAPAARTRWRSATAFRTRATCRA